MRGTKSAGTALSTLHDSLHAEVGAKFGLVRGERGSQRKHEAVSVTEATKRHAKDQNQAIEARKRELDAKERGIVQRRRNLDVRSEKVAEVARQVDEAHAQNVAADERAREANAAAKEKLEAEAKRLAQRKRDIKADDLYRSHISPHIERKRRERAEKQLADYKRIADPLIEAARHREAAKRKEREAREVQWARDDEAEAERQALGRKQEQEQAKKRLFPLFEPRRGKDGGRGREPKR